MRREERYRFKSENSEQTNKEREEANNTKNDVLENGGDGVLGLIQIVTTVIFGIGDRNKDGFLSGGFLFDVLRRRHSPIKIGR